MYRWRERQNYAVVAGRILTGSFAGSLDALDGIGWAQAKLRARQRIGQTARLAIKGFDVENYFMPKDGFQPRQIFPQ